MVQQIFIINGRRVSMKVKYSRMDSNLIEVTSFSNAWRQWISSGNKELEIQGMADNGQEISGVFKIISQLEDGTLQIESMTDKQ